MRSVMNLVLSRHSSRVLLVLLCVLCSAAIIIVAGRMWLAAHWASSRNPRDWARAAQLEPGNAAYWSQLGLYEEWDFAHGNIHQAVRDFEQATRLNPRSDLLWTALASAYEVSGQPGKARQAYAKAQEAKPVSAEVAWQFGNFLLRQGETQQAAAQVREALLNRPELTPSAISQFSRAGVGLDRILNQMLPARRKDYLAALNYFLSHDENDAALASWEKLAGLGQKIPLNKSLGLIDGLLAANRASDAERVWQQALVSSGRVEAKAGGSLIFNGGFEHSLVNGGFGWRWMPTYGAVLDLVGDITHSGAQSARVTFDGTANCDFSSLRQYVAVDPGTRYRFSAYMRTDKISTDSGPQFVIWTCNNPVHKLAQTPAMVGTHPWTNVQANFTPGPGTDCVDVVLRRAPSQMFDNQIRGTVWVDDVRLIPAPAPGSGRE
jgi:Tfp pilus assembly protein PilF